MDKEKVMRKLNCQLDNNLNFNSMSFDTTTTPNTFTDTDYSCWDYYQREYYPTIIKESYPVYLQERAKDKGKQAFEIIKILKDKKLVQMKKVEDFIDLMGELIKIL